MKKRRIFPAVPFIPDFWRFEPLLSGFWNERFWENRLSRVPEVSLDEKDNNYLLSAEIPGFDKKDISISVEEGYLEINAKKEEREKDTTSKKSFYGVFYLPKDLAVEEGHKATYENGILKITFPKQARLEEKAQTIQIE